MKDKKRAGEARVLDEGMERDIRERHKGHPYCETCYVLAQLDVERAAHKLDLLANQAQIKNLQDRCDAKTEALTAMQIRLEGKTS